MKHCRAPLNAAALAAAFFIAPALHAQPAQGMQQPLTKEPGDAARGRTVVLDKSNSCVLCHAVPGNEGPSGNVGPALAGVGERLSAAQLRLRIVDSTRINPNSVMPAYFRTENLSRVASAYRGKPVLSAQQVEDVVAWLGTLR